MGANTPGSMRFIVFPFSVKGRLAVAGVLTTEDRSADIEPSQSTRAWGGSALRLAIVLLPFAFIALLTARYAVAVPWGDHFEFVKIVQKYQDGTLSLADFYAQHNEHRIFFPNLVMFALAIFTRWNTNYELAFSLVLSLVIFGLLYRLIVRTLRDRWPVFIAAALTSLTLFSPIQGENWLWGWQIEWFMNIFGLVLVVWALAAWKTSRPALKMAVAIAGATLATFSLGSGMLVWVACAPLLLTLHRRWRWLALWAVLGAAEIFMYVSGLQSTVGTSQIPELMQRKLSYVEYVAVFLTRPVVPSYNVTLAILAAVLLVGTLLFTLGYFLRFHRDAAIAFLPWACLAGYAILGAMMTGTSRVVYGVFQAYNSRYTTVSQLLLLSVVIALLMLWQRRPGVTRAATAVALVIVAAVSLAGYQSGLQEMRTMRNTLQAAQLCAHTATSVSDDCLLTLYPSKEIVWERLEYLRRIHWAGL